LLLCGLAKTSLLEQDDLTSYISPTRLTISLHQLNAADIGMYAEAFLHQPDNYPVTGFEPLYIAMPKLGGGRGSVSQN
jgi:hypothetical protein